VKQPYISRDADAVAAIGAAKYLGSLCLSASVMLFASYDLHVDSHKVDGLNFAAV